MLRKNLAVDDIRDGHLADWLRNGNVLIHGTPVYCVVHPMEWKLVSALRAIPSVDSAPAFEFPVKVGQLIDGIGAADLFVGRFPEPRKSLFEQLEHPLGKAPRWVILFGQRITSIIFVVDERQIRNSAQSQPKRLSCTGTAAAGQGVLLISVLTGSSRWMPS